MPNVSNLQSAVDERIELINSLSHIRTKGAKEQTLRRIRELERELGIVGLPYNGSSPENWR